MYRPRMDDSDSKETLWANVLALMERDYGAEKLGRLAREAQIAPATMTRLKERQTSVGVNVIEAIARVFRVRPWQLLAPNLGSDLHIIKGTSIVSVITMPPRPAVVAEPAPSAKTSPRAFVRGIANAARTPTEPIRVVNHTPKTKKEKKQ